MISSRELREGLRFTQDERNLLFGRRCVLVEEMRSQGSLEWALRTVWESQRVDLAWSVLHCLEGVSGKRGVNQNRPMISIHGVDQTRPRGVFWHWGKFRVPILQHALSMLGYLHHTRFEEWERYKLTHFER